MRCLSLTQELWYFFKDPGALQMVILNLVIAFQAASHEGAAQVGGHRKDNLLRKCLKVTFKFNCLHYSTKIVFSNIFFQGQ